VSTEPRIASQPADTPPPRNDVQSDSPPQPSVSVKQRPAWGIWLLRVRALLFVTVCATFGVLLIILPWTPKWTDNPLLLSHPDLREFIASGFARGFASGLGVLDLLLGFWEAIHYHENPKGSGPRTVNSG
jgi:hypothetical protein